MSLLSLQACRQRKCHFHECIRQEVSIYVAKLKAVTGTRNIPLSFWMGTGPKKKVSGWWNGIGSSRAAVKSGSSDGRECDCDMLPNAERRPMRRSWSELGIKTSFATFRDAERWPRRGQKLKTENTGAADFARSMSWVKLSGPGA